MLPVTVGCRITWLSSSGQLVAAAAAYDQAEEFARAICVPWGCLGPAPTHASGLDYTPLATA